MSHLQSITPQRAAELLRDGAKLIDIREADEHARERISQAHHHAASALDRKAPACDEGQAVIFHCRSGARTAAHAARLAAAIKGQGYVLEGGLDAWKRAGLPVVVDRGQPIDIQRQVQIAAGALILGGSLLGFFVAPAFFALPLFVGGGLLFAGVSGYCGMAKLLMRLPWNRRAVARS
jgi:rhodanese-related sulfurtransferase